MVGLKISVHFQQFKDLNFLIFSRGSMPQDPPKTQAELPTVPKLGRNVPILLENPES